MDTIPEQKNILGLQLPTDPRVGSIWRVFLLGAMPDGPCLV